MREPHGATTGNIPDSPANGAVVDKNSGTVYVGTDVGVFSTDTPAGSSTVWTEVGPATGIGALPNVAVTRLAIFAPAGQPARLRVSTYGRGIWEMPLASAASFSVAISNPDLLTYPNQPVTFVGSAIATNGYSNTVTISCNAGSGTVPQTCNATPPTLVPSTSSTDFTVSASNPSLGIFPFRIQGMDTNGLTWPTPVSLRVIDFTLSTPNPASVPNLQRGDSAPVQLRVNSLGSFDQTVNFGCTGLPANWSCTATPVTLTAGGNVIAVVTISSDPSSVPQTYNLTLNATWNGGAGVVRTQSQPLAVTVVPTTFVLGGPKFDSSVVKVRQPLTSTITLSSPDFANKALTLSCTGSSLGIAPSACTFYSDPNHTNVITSAVVSSAPVPVYLVVTTASGIAGSGQITVQATDGVETKVAVLPFTLTDYSISNVSQPNDAAPGGGSTFTFFLTPLSGYNSSVSLACDTSAFTVPVSCVFNPSSPTQVPDTTTKVSVSMAIPSNEPNGTYTVTLKTNDSTFPSLAHNQSLGSFSVTVPADYGMSFGTTNNATVKAGATATGTMAVTAVGSFNSAVTFTIAGCPSNATCTMSPNPANPTASSPVNTTLTVVTKAASVGSLLGLGSQRNYLALWIGISFGAVGFVFLRRTRGSVSLLVIAFAMLLGMSACGGGGGSSNSTPTPVPIPGTPAGTYIVRSPLADPFRREVEVIVLDQEDRLLSVPGRHDDGVRQGAVGRPIPVPPCIHEASVDVGAIRQGIHLVLEEPGNGLAMTS